jgi:CubicO group peptidase (beta-lactamase class C family)
MMTLKRRSFFALLLAAAFAVGVGRAQQSATLPAGLDDYVARVMRAFEVPGVSLAVVKDGHSVLAKGYGVRRLGGEQTVDSQTLFGIASNTKVFTAIALGILVDEGKVEWDAHVVRYLPWFQLSDPYVTRELTIRDLLVHRSGLGLGAGDLLWWPESTYDRKEIARRLQFLPLVTSFRNAYAYDNVLYIVAGEVIEAISGNTWEAFIESRILKPVGMRTTTVRHSGAGGEGNIAVTHARVNGRVQPIRPFISDNTNPAGGINSNADDMAKWLGVLLGRGQLADGSRLVSEQTFRVITSWVTPTPVGEPPTELAATRANAAGYALGLGVRDYRGQGVLTHTGGLPGYVSRVYLLPDANLGVAVLTNQESGEAFDAITYFIVDHYLHAPKTDWLSAYQAAQARTLANIADQEKKAVQARNSASRPSLPLASYAGTYRDAWYGDIVVAQEGSRLSLRFTKTPALIGDLEHWQYDTFVVRWRDRELRADAYVTFALNPDGKIDQAKMQAVSPATDFSFDFQDLLLKPVAK